MFIPIDSTTAKNIRNIGYIDFRIFQGWEDTAVKTTYRMVPNNVVYVNSLTHTVINLFECVVSIGNSVVIVDDFNMPAKNSFLVDYKINFKALLHFYLGYAIDEAIMMAKELSKSKLIVKSALPGIASILFEKDFIIRPSDIFDKVGTAEGFKGLKKL